MMDNFQKQVNLGKSSLSFIEGFLNDFKPFRDMLEELGYIDKNFNITEKGNELLKIHWEKELNDQSISISKKVS